MRYSRLSLPLGAAALALALGACGDTTDPAGSAGAAPSASTPTRDTADLTAQTTSLTMTDPWVKAAEAGMTAAFGTLGNSGDQDLTVVAATTRVAATMELHETVQGSDGTMTMQPKEDGFVVPAGGRLELAPGGDHLMLMGLDRALEPGETVPFALTLADGSTVRFEATVKRFTGADEHYQPGGM